MTSVATPSTWPGYKVTASCTDILTRTILTHPGRSSQQVRELGLPKILDVIYVGCPASGKAEGVLELRMALYDIAFSLTLPRCKCSFITWQDCLYLCLCPCPVPPLPLSSSSLFLLPPLFFPHTPFLSLSSHLSLPPLSPPSLSPLSFSFPSSATHGAASRTKLLEQPIPASFLKLEERVRELAVERRAEDKPPMLTEGLFR